MSDDAPREDAPSVDALYLGLTRPAMFGGITFSCAVVILIITAVIFLGSKSLVYTAVSVPIQYAIGRYFTWKDVRYFDIWLTKLRYFSKCRNKDYWGGNSYDPF